MVNKICPFQQRYQALTYIFKLALVGRCGAYSNTHGRVAFRVVSGVVKPVESASVPSIQGSRGEEEATMTKNSRSMLGHANGSDASIRAKVPLNTGLFDALLGFVTGTVVRE